MDIHIYEQNRCIYDIISFFWFSAMNGGASSVEASMKSFLQTGRCFVTMDYCEAKMRYVQRAGRNGIVPNQSQIYWFFVELCIH